MRGDLCSRSWRMAWRLVLAACCANSCARGHDVFTPTLTGVCERSHLLTPDVDLNTHISDIVNLIKWNALKDVVLVGHSYGGMIISAVAEKG